MTLLQLSAKPKQLLQRNRFAARQFYSRRELDYRLNMPQITDILSEEQADELVAYIQKHQKIEEKRDARLFTRIS